jgi:hypothetical protein
VPCGIKPQPLEIYIMATSRITFGAVLDAVGTTATVFSTTMNALGDGASVMGAYMTKLQAEQAKRHIADAEAFTHRLTVEKAEERAASNIAVEKFCAKSAEHRKHFEAAFNLYDQLLRPQA